MVAHLTCLTRLNQANMHLKAGELVTVCDVRDQYLCRTIIYFNLVLLFCDFLSTGSWPAYRNVLLNGVGAFPFFIGQVGVDHGEKPVKKRWQVV